MCDVLGVDLSASYMPGKQSLPTGRLSRQRAKDVDATTTETDERIIRPQTIMQAAAILGSLAQRTGKDNGIVSKVDGS